MRSVGICVFGGRNDEGARESVRTCIEHPCGSRTRRATGEVGFPWPSRQGAGGGERSGRGGRAGAQSSRGIGAGWAAAALAEVPLADPRGEKGGRAQGAGKAEPAARETRIDARRSRSAHRQACGIRSERTGWREGGSGEFEKGVNEDCGGGEEGNAERSAGERRFSRGALCFPFCRCFSLSSIVIRRLLAFSRALRGAVGSSFVLTLTSLYAATLQQQRPSLLSACIFFFPSLLRVYHLLNALSHRSPLSHHSFLSHQPAFSHHPFLSLFLSLSPSLSPSPLCVCACRYVEWGRVTAAAAAELSKEEVKAHFARLIQRVAPKSWAQALGEVEVTLAFLRNFTGDQVRFLARSFGSPGDHTGQLPTGHRWPYGPVALIAPFNFPLEIAALQVMGAFYMGNRPTVHVDAKVSVVMEEFFRLLLACGAPPESFDLLHGRGTTMNELLLRGEPRSTLFTGSQKVAEHLAVQLRGKVYLEDAGFDWKILGPDVSDLDHVAWQCDQDAYASTGQKCSAQSCLFAHSNWIEAGLLDEIEKLAAARSLDALTVGPVLTWSTERILAHVDRLLKIPGSKLLFGGKELANHTIPSVYGAVEPTAVYVPLKGALASEDAFEAFSTEVFGPFQVVTSYSSHELPLVLEATERMHAHLTAAVVSKDPVFVNTVLGNTVNGTTYAGIRARTTGAPQNHWFGPAGDPRAAGIGTPEAIRLVWSTHREIIYDVGPAAPPEKRPQS